MLSLLKAIVKSTLIIELEQLSMCYTTAPAEQVFLIMAHCSGPNF